MTRLGRGHPARAYVFIPSGRGVVNAVLTLAATVTTTPAKARRIGRNLPLASVSTTRFDVRQVRPIKKASVSVTRNMVRRVGRVLLKVMTLVVVMTKVKLRLVTFLASVALAGARVRRIGPVKAASVSLTRFRALRGRLPRARIVTLSGVRMRALSFHKQGTVTVNRAMVRRIATAKATSVTLTRFAVRSFLRKLTLAATVTLTRFSTRTVQHVRASLATIALTGLKVRQVGVKRVKQFTLSPTMVRCVKVVKAKTVTVTRFRSNAASKLLRAPVVLTGISSLIKLKKLVLAAVVTLNARTLRRITHTQKAVSTLVARVVRQPGIVRRAQVALARFRSIRGRVVRLGVSITTALRLRAIAPIGKSAAVHMTGARRAFLGIRHTAIVTTARMMVRALARVRLAQVSTARSLRRALTRTARTTVVLTARTATATARYRAYLASVATARTALRVLGVRRAGQVVASPTKLRSVLRRFKASATLTGARSVKRGYALAKLALASTVGTRIAHRTVAKTALASITLTTKRVRRISRTTLRVVTAVGVKRVAIRLTNSARTSTSVILRGVDRVLRLLAPGHSSPGILTGRKTTAAALAGRVTGGGMSPGNSGSGAAMIGRSVVGGIAGNRTLGSSMNAAPNAINGAVSMYRVVKSTHVGTKGSVKRV